MSQWREQVLLHLTSQLPLAFVGACGLTYHFYAAYWHVYQYCEFTAPERLKCISSLSKRHLLIIFLPDTWVIVAKADTSATDQWAGEGEPVRFVGWSLYMVWAVAGNILMLDSLGTLVSVDWLMLVFVWCLHHGGMAISRHKVNFCMDSKKSCFCPLWCDLGRFCAVGMEDITSLSHVSL